MTTSTEEAIRARAYQLWKEAGEPDGQAEAFWHQAEDELCRESTELASRHDRQSSNLIAA